MENNHVMFLLFKVPEVYTECHFHLLRYLATRDREKPQPGYLIYADQPSQFDRWRGADLDLKIIPTPLEQIEAWCGPQRFVFRAKIMAIKDALHRTGGNLVYCDTDTYPRCDLNPLFRRLDNGELFMYENEGSIDRSINKHFFAYDKRFREHPALRVGPRVYDVPLTTDMWNAGVIGIGQTAAAMIDEVLAFSDALYREWQYLTVEQFSMGYVFQNSEQGCAAAKEFIYHYWPVRRYAVLLNRLFELYSSSALDRLIRASDRILAEELVPVKQSWEASRPFQFLWRNYPYGVELMSRVDRRQWPIEKEFSRLDSVS
jgi:hypothetical protein